MPFDPNIPANNSPNSSAQMRGQLTSLKALIDAVQSITAAQVDGVTTVNPGDPAVAGVSVVSDTLHFTFAIPRGDVGAAGTPGNDGAPGPPFAQAIVDAVNTLNPGDNATVGVTFDGTNVHFTFGIPRGSDGGQGTPGSNGTDGGPGPTGAQGPPFAQAIVDAVNTVSPGSPAAVNVSFDGTNVHFSFNIPQGATGDTGATGVPGEVTNADLQNAVTTLTNDSSSNTNAVDTLDTPFGDSEAEALRVKLNEFILAARR